MFPRDCPGAVQITRQSLIEDLVHKRALSRTGDARHTGHHAKRKVHIDIFQVVLLRADHLQPPGRFLPLFRYRYFDLPGKVSACDRLLVFHDLVSCAHSHNFTAMFACSRSDIHDIICCKHGVLIVFHDNKRISEVSQMLERSEQLVIVSLVESDARLIQNICHADQTGADLGGKPDTLRLAA